MAQKISAELNSHIDSLRNNVNQVVQGKEEVVDLVLTCVLAGGHVLIEDVPGVGKTTLAMAVALSLGCSFQRIQFTSDMLPSDVIGVSLFNQKTQEFEFRKGPLFSQVVLADEINRTSPRTQSALLESMNEGKITTQGQTYDLERPFLVFATQNPIESFGAYPLPDSQLDRFLMRLHMGYPDPETEKHVLRNRKMNEPVEALKAVLNRDVLLKLQEEVDLVHMEEALEDYLHALILETRESPLLSVGVSTRGALLFHRAVRAFARLHGRDYVLPDDIKTLAVPCLAHRISLKQRTNADAWSSAQSSEAERVVLDMLNRLAVPL